MLITHLFCIALWNGMFSLVAGAMAVSCMSGEPGYVSLQSTAEKKSDGGDIPGDVWIEICLWGSGVSIPHAHLRESMLT